MIRMRRPARGVIGRSTTFPPTEPNLPKTLTATPHKGFKQGINDFRRPGYGGPCPPSRHGPHHYHFRLLALSIPSLPLRGRPTCKDVEREARKHVLAEAALVGTLSALETRPARPS